MVPLTNAELEQLRTECKLMVRKRAIISAGASSIPALGVDIAADAAILLELIPAINHKFGLAKEQIDGYNPAAKQIIYQVIKRAGLSLVGAEVTKQLVLHAMKMITGRTMSKQMLKFVPVVGWAANTAIGYAAMRYVGNAHVNDCYETCKQMMGQLNVIEQSNNTIGTTDTPKLRAADFF